MKNEQEASIPIWVLPMLRARLHILRFGIWDIADTMPTSERKVLMFERTFRLYQILKNGAEASAVMTSL